jgi:hypothetical protein
MYTIGQYSIIYDEWYCVICVLRMMQGVEYITLHVQNPILFIIRKQLRDSPNHGTDTK